MRFGDSNFDFVQIMSGPRAGEEIVVSDLKEQRNTLELMAAQFPLLATGVIYVMTTLCALYPSRPQPCERSSFSGCKCEVEKRQALTAANLRRSGNE